MKVNVYTSHGIIDRNVFKDPTVKHIVHMLSYYTQYCDNATFNAMKSEELFM